MPSHADLLHFIFENAHSDGTPPPRENGNKQIGVCVATRRLGWHLKLSLSEARPLPFSKLRQQYLSDDAKGQQTNQI